MPFGPQPTSPPTAAPPRPPSGPTAPPPLQLQLQPTAMRNKKTRKQAARLAHFASTSRATAVARGTAVWYRTQNE
eukprot:scaffold295121_cov31-Tisochrysis_lutea.AAC.2